MYWSQQPPRQTPKMHLSAEPIGRPSPAFAGRGAVRCQAGGGWPWSRRDPAPPPPPPPPPPVQQPPSSATADDLLRTSPKWRSWPDSAAQSAPLNPSVVQPPQTQKRRKRASRGELSAEQQVALQDMLLDSTVNPKWRWPTFGGTSSAASQQQVKQRQWGQEPPRPPPPPPQPTNFGRWQQQQQSPQPQQQQQDPQQPPQPQQQQWQWPFVGKAFDPTPEPEFRQRLEAMGVDLMGKKGREKQQQQYQDMMKSFEQMDDREVARCMNQMRQNRLDKVQNKQDDEVVGIAGLYLSVTLLILFMAALANLPT